MNEQLIESYLAGPAKLRAAVTGMSREQLVARPIPGKWSILEVVCHVADMDGMMANRMKYVLAEDRPVLANADETRWTAALACHDRNVDEELAMLEATRRQMASILRAQRDEAWHRVGVHSVDGPVTLQKFVERCTRHVEHHLAFIDEKRKALGKS